jgi:nucleoside-diphosphate-sugar epimerase
MHKILESNYSNPINLGSNRMISINNLALLISKISNKTIKINHIKGPIGVMGRNSDNTLIKSILNWSPPDNLEYGLSETYKWILNQLK